MVWLGIILFGCLGTVIAASAGLALGGLIKDMGWFSESKKELRRQRDEWKLTADIREGTRDYWIDTAQRRAASIWSLRKELAAEQAKKKCTECKDYTVTVDAAKGVDGTVWITGIYKSDTEAERVASLPKCGTTKKCDACGGTELERTLIGSRGYHGFLRIVQPAKPEHQYMRLSCKCGRVLQAQERPLFNKGK